VIEPSGEGDATLYVESGEAIELKGAVYARGARGNLLSIPRMDRRGFGATLLDGEMTTFDPRRDQRPVAIGALGGGSLYQLRSRRPVEMQVASAKASDKSAVASSVGTLLSSDCKGSSSQQSRDG